ncbi:MAG TPA: hypothetical protein VJP76_00390 [Candidatus Tumulicola sp.]|nr:hypothetical protein [Candidatus Tumulicola sp.]
MRLSISRSTVLAFVFALILGVVVGGVAVAATQVHMRNARTDLQAALGQLNAASSDKAGHRVNAMHLVDQAINEVNLGIAAGAQ